MKLITLVLSLAVSKGALANAVQPRALSTCSNGNNCARAVYGTAGVVTPALSIRQADCSRYMQTTVTPAISTVTVTVSTTTTSIEPTGGATIVPRTVTSVTSAPGGIPTYASACSGTSAYSSACSCFGITHVVITATTPITTTTVTTTATASACPTGASQCGASCFDLQTDPNNCGTCGNVCPSEEQCSSGGCVPANAETCVLSQTGECYAACNANQACACQPTADDQLVGVCNSGVGCGSVPTCTTQSDCDANSVCLITCCGTLCIPLDVVCTNPASPARIFRQRSMWSTNSN